MAAARPARIAACGIALLAWLACGGEEQAAEESQPKPEWSTEKTPSPAIANTLDEEGKPIPSAVVREELPPDFPLDVPKYPGAEVKSSRVAARGGMSVALTSGDALDDVISYYEKTFSENGWSTDVRPTPEGTAIFADKEGRTASALVRGGGEGTTVDLIVIER